MPTFSVNYDLRDSKNYDAIHEAIEKHPNCHVQRSFWIMKYDGTAKDLRIYLQKFLNKEDFVFVIKITDDWSSFQSNPTSDCFQNLIS